MRAVCVNGSHSKALVLSICALLVSCALTGLPGKSGASDDARDPGNVNKLLDISDTPGKGTEGLAPGESGKMTFVVTNPYNGNMTSILVKANIYKYATIEEEKDVTSSWKTPYIQESGTLEWSPALFDLEKGKGINVSFTVVTAADTTHGGVFTQSSYFIRFWMEFDYTNASGTAHLVMKSKGYFSDADWDEATREPADTDKPYYRGELNISYLAMKSGQLDGIIPDSSFVVKEPMPVWPFYALVVLMIVSLFLALMFYIEEKPGTWPWMEVRWSRFKGKIYRAKPVKKKARKVRKEDEFQ